MSSAPPPPEKKVHFEDEPSPRDRRPPREDVDDMSDMFGQLAAISVDMDRRAKKGEPRRGGGGGHDNDEAEEDNTARASAASSAAQALEAEAKKIDAQRKLEAERAKAEHQKLMAEKEKAKAVAKGTAELTKAMKDKYDRAKAAKDEPDVERSLQEHMKLFTIYTRYKNERGLPGSGKRVDFNSHTSAIEAEIEVQRDQAARQRAKNVLPQIILAGVGMTERACLENGRAEVMGVTARMAHKLEADVDLQMAMLELEIEYSSYFAVGPKMAVGMAVAGCFKETIAANAARSSEAYEPPDEYQEL